MSEETPNEPEKVDTTQEPVENPTPEAKPVPEKTAEEIANDELEELNREIEEASKSLVSEDVAKVIKLEKEAAKKEAEKEFLTNQRVKELEAEKLALQKEKEQAEKEAAAKLDALTQRVNGLISSRAPVQAESPFNAPALAEESTSIDNISDEQAKEIELASMEAFWNRRPEFDKE